MGELAGEDTAKEQAECLEVMLYQSKPADWNVHNPNNAELKHENGFEVFMFKIAEHTKEDLDKITVYRFYTLLDYITAKTE